MTSPLPHNPRNNKSVRQRAGLGANGRGCMPDVGPCWSFKTNALPAELRASVQPGTPRCFSAADTVNRYWGWMKHQSLLWMFFCFFFFQKIHKNPRKMIVLLWLQLHCSSCYILLLLDFIYGPNYTWNQATHAKKINIGDKHKHRRVDFLVLYVCRYGILLLPCRQTEEYSFFLFCFILVCFLL